MTLRFDALDTWFFRESRPFDSIGGSELQSVFPPPARTVMGAVRSLIGESRGSDWRAYRKAPESYQLPDGQRLQDLIGAPGEDAGPLSLRGPWLVEGEARLYPVPLSLLAVAGRAGTPRLLRLRVGDAATTSLGSARVRLPELPPSDGDGESNAGAKTMERAWITAEGLSNFLGSGLPAAESIRTARQGLYAQEARLGIARDNRTRVNRMSLLYQTRHVRPAGNVAIEIDLSAPDAIASLSGLTRLGGEGRLANVRVADGARALAAPEPSSTTRGLLLGLLTPALLGDNGRPGWLPPGFEACDEHGERTWQGEIESVRLTLHCAVIGKAHREGGWDQARGRPRDAASLVPAGSCYYVTADVPVADAIEALHGAQIGAEQALGRGEIACGLWDESEF